MKNKTEVIPVLTEAFQVVFSSVNSLQPSLQNLVHERAAGCEYVKKYNKSRCRLAK